MDEMMTDAKQAAPIVASESNRGFPSGMTNEGERSRTGCEARSPLLARLRRVVCERDGSMALEAAFVLPTFFVVLFGIFELSMLLTGYCSAAYAVRVGARYASVHSATSLAPASSANVQSFAQANLFTPGSSSSVVPAVTYTPNSNAVGNVVNVTATWSQSISLPGYHSTIAVSTQAHRVIVR